PLTSTLFPYTTLFRSDVRSNAAPIPLSEIALTGIFEISKILAAPTRLEITLANVVNLLQSFMQMRHGVVSLLADDGIPDLAVGADRKSTRLNSSHSQI